jgi:hypothetical protein
MRSIGLFKSVSFSNSVVTNLSVGGGDGLREDLFAVCHRNPRLEDVSLKSCQPNLMRFCDFYLNIWAYSSVRKYIWTSIILA